MLIDRDNLEHLLNLYTDQNAEAYRAKDAVKAFTEAKRQLLSEARQQLNELLEEMQAEELKRLNAKYNAEATEQAKRQAWKQMINDLEEGKTVEVSKHVYEHFLNVLPPLDWSGSRFACSEPVSHNEQGQPVFNCFMCIDGKYYGRQLTRQQLKAWNRFTLTETL